jgi:hypothetical protein
MSTKRKRDRCLFRYQERQYEQEQIKRIFDAQAEREKEIERVKEIKRLEDQREFEEFAKELWEWLKKRE